MPNLFLNLSKFSGTKILKVGFSLNVFKEKNPEKLMKFHDLILIFNKMTINNN